ncbi:putative albumin I chain a [Medicago truncatula]|uniref:Leginsulin/Albumin-1 n=1 Tax=Medicago truncatula TaxID=3880 RepID=A0A072UYQ1_MEDTR|nr:albumin-1 isoform X2 [Medicago truncatula]KEH34243.1 Leginsulin/Albumin-1 [Medicago truncatula]RHN67613.1 putative albumin I chain a [Medicago truncatula]
MAHVKLAPFAAVFLLAAFLMFPMKKVEAADCLISCSPDSPHCDVGCECHITSLFSGSCFSKFLVDPKKMVEKYSKVCQSHTDCTKKGSGSFCGRYPNSILEYGWCFASESEAEDIFFKIASKSKFSKDFLKRPITV